MGIKKKKEKEKYRNTIKLLSSRRWKGVYLPHSALTLNVCCCPLNLTWFKELYSPKKRKKTRSLGEWEVYAPAEEKDENFLLNIMNSIWKRDITADLKSILDHEKLNLLSVDAFWVSCPRWLKALIETRVVIIFFLYRFSGVCWEMNSCFNFNWFFFFFFK